MVKVLIADDEAIIREGIIKSIEWEQYGVAIAGEASNGAEALKIAEDIEPDIVIADIRMPVMDGLELSRRVKQMLPMVKIVILTGYGEFEYAKKAIDLKVSEFVMKPVGAEELVKIIVKLRDEIIYEQLLKENLPEIRGKLLNCLLSGRYTPENGEELLKKARKLNIDLEGPNYQIFLMAIDDYFFNFGSKPTKNKELIIESLLSISREALSSCARGYIFQNETGLFVGLVNTGRCSLPAADLCRNIQYLIRKHLQFTVSIGIGNGKNSIFLVDESYREAFSALRYRFFKGKNVVISVNDVKADDGPAEQISIQSCADEEKELLLRIKLLDRKGAEGLIDDLFGRLLDVKADHGNIKNISLNLLLASFRELNEMGIDTDERPNMHFDPFQEIERYETAEDIKTWLIDMIDELIGIVESEKNENYRSIVKIAMEYMAKHYSEPISLSAIAGNVHVTPNYLSRVFRKETGESFLEWLNRFRLEKSKRLLGDSSLKTYEVAEKVGFHDYKHFSYNFKKYMNCSPTEYKKQIIKG